MGRRGRIDADSREWQQLRVGSAPLMLSVNLSARQFQHPTLADGLELSVTGEGIETVAQKLLLQALGCQRGQGYLFARPLSADDAHELLVENTKPARDAA